MRATKRLIVDVDVSMPTIDSCFRIDSDELDGSESKAYEIKCLVIFGAKFSCFFFGFANTGFFTLCEIFPTVVGLLCVRAAISRIVHPRPMSYEIDSISSIERRNFCGAGSGLKRVSLEVRETELIFCKIFEILFLRFT